VYLPGPPGTGKSHAAEQAATMLGWNFASLSLGPTTPESRLWGGMDAHGNFHEPPFIKLARHAQDNPDSGSVYCLDELDNGNSGVIATLNSAMANGWFTAPNGDVISMGRNFVIIGAANTYGTGPTAEFAGRNKLDAATLDRFVYLPWDTDLGVETALTKTILETAVAKAWLEVWRTCRKNAKDNGLKVFVTMRGCLNGAKLISAGFSPQEALEVVLLNKLPDDQRRKVWSS
jgi:MoxR-like ATPase